MSTFDYYKSVSVNVGQEVRAQDINDAQRFLGARLTDQVFSSIIPPQVANGLSDPDICGVGDTSWCYVLSHGAAILKQGSANNKVKIGAGTVFQYVSFAGGDESTFLPYTFVGLDEVSFANGDGTHPRVDLIQMKLEWVADDSQTRVFAQEAVKASIDMGAHTTHFNTKLRARAAGRGGESIQVRTVSGGAPGYSESGNQVTFTYVTGVTTVAALEALIVSTLVEIDTPGTGANVLSSPADTVGYTFMTGGEDQVLTSSTFDMKRRVQCTLSVVPGTPAASPAYPAPTAGYVAIGAVVVPTSWAWGSGVVFHDDPASPVVHDLRMPLRVKPVTVAAYNGFYEPSTWVPQDNHNTLKCNTNTDNAGNRLVIPCPVTRGRLVGIAIRGKGDNAGSAVGDYVDFATSIVDLADTSDVASGGVGVWSYTLGMQDILEANTFSNAVAAHGYGPPIWCNGQRAQTEEFRLSVGNPVSTHQLVCYLRAKLNLEVQHVTFFIAEGL